mgnify:CR=1 FL=1
MLHSFLNTRGSMLLVSPQDDFHTKNTLEALMPNVRIMPCFAHSNIVDLVNKHKPDLVLFNCSNDLVAINIDMVAIIVNKNVPVLFCADRNDTELIEKRLNFGFTDYVPLPIDSAEAQQRIMNSMALKKSVFAVNKQNNFLKDINNHKNILFTLGSHEIKNSLKIIHGFSKIIEEKHSTLSVEDIADFSKDIREASQVIQHIISDIIDIYVYESQSCEVFNELIDVHELAARSIETFEQAAEKKNIRVKCSSPSEDVLVYSDFRKLKQMLDNLVSNAINFSSFNKDVEIRIDKYYDEYFEKDSVRIAVKNFGPVIPDEYRTKIFEKFKRFPFSNGEPSNSTGLGLAIVKALSLMLDVKVAYSSSAEKGTSFDLSMVEWKN